MSNKKEYIRKWNKSKVSLLSAHDKWEDIKKNWIDINFKSAEKIRPRPEYQSEEEISYSTGGSFKNIPPILHRCTNEVLLPLYKMDSHFANHLLRVHDKYCKDCFKDDDIVSSAKFVCSCSSQIITPKTYDTKCVNTDFLVSISTPKTYDTKSVNTDSPASFTSIFETGVNCVLDTNSVNKHAEEETVSPLMSSRKRLWTSTQQTPDKNVGVSPYETPHKRTRLPDDIIQSTPFEDSVRKRVWSSRLILSPVRSVVSPKSNLSESFNTNATIGSPKSTDFPESCRETDDGSGSGISNVLRYCFVDPQKVIPLVHNVVGSVCKVNDCDKPLTFKSYFWGALFKISWTCSNRKPHSGKWIASDENFNDMLSSSILYSGASYSMLENFYDLMNVQFLSHTSVYNNQKKICYPAIQKYWDFQQVSFFAKLDRPLVIMVDSRCDSPGYSAKQCSCTAMDFSTQKIIAIEFADRRHTKDKSGNMEPYCFRKLMEKLQSKCTIAEVVTDGHIQIKSIMKKEYPTVKHSHDIWHVSKNLRKKLHKLGKEKYSSDILLWVKDLVNHFWWCAEHCNQDADLMRILWLSFLHHVQNEHEWATGGCYHEDLSGEERDKPWLSPHSVAYQKLESVVRDKAFLGDFPYYINYRHTGALESYHSLLLKYASKRLNFPWQGYIARNIVTVLDYNSNVERPQAQKKDGELRAKNKNSKVSSNWTRVPIKVTKTNAFAKELLDLTLSGEVNLSAYELFPNDPQKIRKNIAMTPCPPTVELEKARLEYTRFQNKNIDEDVAKLLQMSNDDSIHGSLDDFTSGELSNDKMNNFFNGQDKDLKSDDTFSESDEDDYKYFTDFNDN